MTDGVVLPPGAGERIQSAGMTLKLGSGRSARWSVFEADVAPGFDVGAHLHQEAEELLYVLEGELDLLEPWVAPAGHEHYLRDMGELLAGGGPPDPSAIAALRARYDIEQLTPMVPPGRPRAQEG